MVLRRWTASTGLLAASAKVRGWTLVTRNSADPARSGVSLLSPFEPASRG
jgi:toxin FitB